MQNRLQEFRSLGAEIVVVTFATPLRLSQYVQSRRWPFRVLADPERAAYRAFELERASWRRLLRPRVLARYLGLVLRGWLPRPAHEDVHQLGGDFVLDECGAIVYAHRSADPADRPAVTELLAAVASIAPARRTIE